MKRYVVEAIERRLTSLVIAIVAFAPFYILSLNEAFKHWSFLCGP